MFHSKAFQMDVMGAPPYKSPSTVGNEVSLWDSKYDHILLSDSNRTCSESISINNSQKKQRFPTNILWKGPETIVGCSKSTITERCSEYCEAFIPLQHSRGGCFLVDRADDVDEDTSRTNGQKRVIISEIIAIDEKDESYYSIFCGQYYA